MSRNIPKVQRWYFRYYIGRRLIYIAAVSAPTKLLARLVARDQIARLVVARDQMFDNDKWWHAFLDADRVTISLKSPTTETEIER